MLRSVFPSLRDNFLKFVDRLFFKYSVIAGERDTVRKSPHDVTETFTLPSVCFQFLIGVVGQ